MTRPTGSAARSRRWGRILTVAFAAIGLTGPGPRADEVLIDGIAAQVGSEIVLLSDVQELARPVEQRMRAAGVSEDEIRNMHADALERLIEAKLIESVVHRLEMTVEQGFKMIFSAGMAVPESAPTEPSGAGR